jgi:hypothetical protein
MSEQELVKLINDKLDDDSNVYSQTDRERKVQLKGNQVLAQNIGVPVYEYLDTIYFDRIKKYIDDTYEQRIKTLEDKVSALETRVR